MKVAEVLADRALQKRAVVILVDRRRPAQLRILIIGEFAE
jgi:hypothetical protein